MPFNVQWNSVDHKWRASIRFFPPQVLKLSGNEVQLNGAKSVVNAVLNKPVIEMLELKGGTINIYFYMVDDIDLAREF